MTVRAPGFVSATALGVLWVALSACGSSQLWTYADDEPLWYPDLDGDGWGDEAEVWEEAQACRDQHGVSCIATGGDCDDRRDEVHPFAAEWCNGRDDDCDGAVDEGEPVDRIACHLDADSDGWGRRELEQWACDCPVEMATNGDDCDDGNAAVHPEVSERCNGYDDDCDGAVDEPGAVDAPWWFRDRDGDGWGDGGSTWQVCSCPDGFVGAAVVGDCDDGDPAVYPGAEELWYDGVDQDCDGASDYDADQDGFESADQADGGEDCDDADAEVSPDAVEACNGVDDDCDGIVDFDADDPFAWWRDRDGDGYGADGVPALRCDELEGWAPVPGDCDDVDAAINPVALDHQGDGVDDDCDGLPDQDWALGADSAVALAASADALLGSAVAWVGDQDGDGLSDVLVGMAGYSAGAEGAGGALLLAGSGDPPATLAVLGGRALDGALGSAVAGLGDVDGDGIADLGLGAPGDGFELDRQGVVYLLFGPVSADQDLDSSGAVATVLGEAAGDRAAGVVGAGDVDGDGYADLLVGAPGESTLGADAGAVYLMTGPVTGQVSLSSASTKLLGRAAGDGASAVASVGDVDGDGVADLLVGAWGADDAGINAGVAYLCNGPVWGTAELSIADAELLGRSPLDMAGWSVAGAGDVDADGHDDVLVGAIGVDGVGADAGAAYLLLGPLTGSVDLGAAEVVLQGDAAGDRAGIRVAGAGDVDGDSHADLLVGASGSDRLDTDAGLVSLFLGPVRGSWILAEASVAIAGSAAGMGLGQSMAGGVDADGDGSDDLVLGATGLDGGAIWLLFGPLP